MSTKIYHMTLQQKIQDYLKSNASKFQHWLGIDRIIYHQRLIEDVYIPAAVKHPVVFSKYKGINRGKSVVLVGSGPSSIYYRPMKDVVHFGINNAIFRDDIYFEYYMSNDYDGNDSLYEKIFSKGSSLKVFLGIPTNSRKGILIPQHYRDKSNVEEFYTCGNVYPNDARYQKNHLFSAPIDISVSPLYSYGTVYHMLMQLALWTHPSKIYLVGADCFGTSRSYYTEEEKDMGFYTDYRMYIIGWKYLKDFSDQNYPDVEIISINPVGLEGLFKDIYTKEYVDKMMR